MTTREAAHHYRVRYGWLPVPIPFRSKGPVLKGWQHLRLAEADLPAHFDEKPQNIGILLGPVSGGLVDVDLDCAEALRLAPYFLPATLTFGRKSKPNSHWLYTADAEIRTKKYALGKQTLVELRGASTKGTPHQTVFPSSVHESGEPIRFENKRRPEHTDATELQGRVRRLACACLLLRTWPTASGTRHDRAMALSGALLRAGWSAGDTEAFIRAIATEAGDTEVEDRLRAVRDTKAALDAGGEVTGWPRLSALFGEDTVRLARRWLGIKAAGQHEGSGKEEARGQAVSPWKPFPLETLPQGAADYVRAQAAAIGCDEAFVALPVLAVLAAAVGNAYRVKIKRSWTETSTIWILTIARSGGGKSPAQDAALLPVYDLERQAKATFDAAMTAYEEALESYTTTPKNERGARPGQPVRRRYRVGDTTVESVFQVHADNPRGLLLARDELAAWFGSFDRYARGEADMQSWIEMHGGRPLIIDRKSSDKPVLSLDRPSVCIAGGIQPEVLKNRLKAEHIDSGFVARLLMAMPPERPRRWSEADVTTEVREAYIGLVQRLYKMDASDEALPLSPEAKALFAAFVNENGALMQRLPGGALRSFLAKIEFTAARLALTLHLAAYATSDRSLPPAEVSSDAMHKALRLARWFRYETARVYQVLHIEQRSLSDDERLALHLPDVFTWEDIAALKSVQRSQAYDIRKRLVAQGLARDHAQRGKYEKIFHWTPDLPDFPDKLPGERLENPENPVSDPDELDGESPENPVIPVSDLDDTDGESPVIPVIPVSDLDDTDGESPENPENPVSDPDETDERRSGGDGLANAAALDDFEEF